MSDKSVKSVLIIGPSWVGDMVMTQTLCQLLQQHNPNIQIDMLAPSWSFPVVSRMPGIDQVINAPFKHGVFHWNERKALGKQLRIKAYDQAILIPYSWKSALVPWFANIPKRTGWLGEQRWGLLNDARSLNEKKYPLMIERIAALAFDKATELPVDIPFPKLSVFDANAALLEHGLVKDDRPILILCPGAEFGSAKRWLEPYYAEVANEKLAAGWQVWLLGSEKDRLVTETIDALTHHRCQNLAGKTTLGSAIDLISIGSCVVSNDSGLMHIAAALNRPLIVVYGPTTPSFTPPLSSCSDIVTLSLSCQPCHKRECPLGHHNCMRELKSSQVLRSIDQLLG